MTVYGFAGNIPCIVVQRTNHMKIARILERTAACTAPLTKRSEGFSAM
jgi:hypothetical protein